MLEVDLGSAKRQQTLGLRLISDTTRIGRLFTAAMSAQRSPSRLLLAAPPALRSDVLRRVLLGVQRRSISIEGTRHICALTSTQHHRFLAPRRIILTRYHASTTATTTTLPVSTPGQPGTTSTTPPPPSPRRLRRLLTSSTLFLLAFSVAFAMSVSPVADTINGFISPPTDAETLTLYVAPTARAEDINERILKHPLAVKLRQDKDMVESRPHLKIPEPMRPHNLTGGTLLGEGRIEVPPLTFVSKSAPPAASDAEATNGDAAHPLPTLVQFAYLGPALCGHPGIVHGGLLATMLDEGLARACFPALPNKVGVTASLKIDYRVPCPAERFVVLKAETTKVEGRKAWVKGWIEVLDGVGLDGKSMEGVKIVEAEALFIEPRGAKQMARVYSSQ